MAVGVAVEAAQREGLLRRTDELLAELAEMWGADGDVIVNLFGVSAAEARRLGLPIACYGTVTVEVGPADQSAYRTVNLGLRTP